MAGLPQFPISTQTDPYWEIPMYDAAGNPLSIEGRVFEAWIAPAQTKQGVAEPVAAIKVLTFQDGMTLVPPTDGVGDQTIKNTLVHQVSREFAQANFPRGELTADLLEVVDGARRMFSPVRLFYLDPAQIREFVADRAGITFGPGRQPIVTPVAIAGQAGRRGSGLLTGTLPPQPSDGEDGDYWIVEREAQANLVYGPKENGEWPPQPSSTFGVGGVADIPDAGEAAKLGVSTPEEARQALSNTVALTPATAPDLVETFVRGAAIIRTRAVAENTVVSPRVTVLTTLGYATIDDAGGATYAARPTEPTHAGKLKTLDGRWWEITSPVLTPEMFGAPVNGALASAAIKSGAAVSGIAGDSAAIIAATNCANAQGGKAVQFRSVSYYIDQDQVFPFAVRWQGSGATRFVQGRPSTAVAGSGASAICWIEPAGGKYVTGQANLLAANAVASDPGRQITLAAGKGANFVEGARIAIKSNAKAPGSGHTCTLAEHAQVESKNGDVLTLTKPLTFSYLVSDAAEVLNLNLIEGVSISGITVEDYPDIYGGPDQGGSNFFLVGCLRPELTDIVVDRSRGPLITLEWCIEAFVQRPCGDDGNSASFTVVPGYSYGVQEIGLNTCLVVEGARYRRIRHGYTTGEQTTDRIGVPMFSHIKNSEITDATGTGWDTHEPGYEVQFTNCHTKGCRDRGLASRSVGTVFESCSASDCFGSAFSLEGFGYNNRIYNCKAYRSGYGTIGSTNYVGRGACWDAAPGTIIDGFVAEGCAGPAIVKGDSAGNVSADALWQNIVSRNNGLAQPVSNNRILGTAGGLTGGVLRIRNVDSRQGSAPVDYGLRNTNAAIRVEATGLDMEGWTVAVHSMLATDSVMGGADLNARSIGRRSVSVAIVNGVLTLTDDMPTLIVVRGEGGAADQLDSIAGGKDRDRITLIFAAETITVAHNSNITLRSGTAYVMSNVRHGIDLEKISGSAWREP